MDLPDVTPPQTSSNNKILIPLVIIILLAGSTWFLMKVLGGKLPSTSSKQSSSGADMDSSLIDYVDFAENLAIALNNISYMNQNEQRADLAGYLSDDLLTSYHKYFYDPDFQRLVADRKIYITYQKIQRSTIDSQSGDTVAVRVTGYNTYRSDLTQTQLEVPFTLKLQIQKHPDGRLQATKLKKL